MTAAGGVPSVVGRRRSHRPSHGPRLAARAAAPTTITVLPHAVSTAAPTPIQASATIVPRWRAHRPRASNVPDTATTVRIARPALKSTADDTARGSGASARVIHPTPDVTTMRNATMSGAAGMGGIIARAEENPVPSTAARWIPRLVGGRFHGLDCRGGAWWARGKVSHPLDIFGGCWQ